MSQVSDLNSEMCVLRSSTSLRSSLAASPVTSPLAPQWIGTLTWWTSCPPTMSGLTRFVTSTRVSIAARAVTIVAQPVCSSPRSAASSGPTSMNSSGCSSDRCAMVRDMPPAVWCSVSRWVVIAKGNTSDGDGW